MLLVLGFFTSSSIILRLISSANVNSPLNLKSFISWLVKGGVFEYPSTLVGLMINNNSDFNNKSDSQESDYNLIDEIDQKLIELLIRGYSNKRIASEAKSPLSTNE